MRFFKRDKGASRRRGPIDAATSQFGDDAQELSPTDLALLATLAEQGADLSRRRHVVHYLYCPSKEGAVALGRDAEAAGYDVQVRGLASTRSDAEGQEHGSNASDRWRVKCDMHGILSPRNITATTAFFNELAERYEAEYDGWEAAVEPSDDA